jgi:Fe-S-cluster-containing dehydrogenase component
MGGKATMKTIIVDIAKCNGCYNCQIACKDEHVDNDWLPVSKPQPDTGHFWMHLTEIERGQYPKVKIAYIAKPCMQCQEPGCMKAAKDGAIYKRKDGIVIIDPIKSKGQKDLVAACPYGSIYWNEELKIPQKCTFCAHLLDKGWKEPRCVQACPTGALSFEDYNVVKSLLKNKRLEVMNPEFGTKPNVCYVGLPQRFIAGAVLFGDKNECAENVTVTIMGGGEKKTAKTDNYGDFEFEGLPVDLDFTVKLECSGYQPQEFSVNTKADIYLGMIKLSK